MDPHDDRNPVGCAHTRGNEHRQVRAVVIHRPIEPHALFEQSGDLRTDRTVIGGVEDPFPGRDRIGRLPQPSPGIGNAERGGDAVFTVLGTQGP